MSATKAIALTLGFGLSLSAASLLLFFLFRKNEDDQYEYESTKTSRHAVIHVPVPRYAVGSVIGRQGDNVKHIQETTKTRINFNDDGDGKGDRIATIRGKPDDVQEAESMILKSIRDNQLIETYEMFVPQKAVGRIIGRNGDNIRLISHISKAKITVDRTTPSRRDTSSQQRVTIKGTGTQIDTARGLIEEKVLEDEAFQHKKTETTNGNEKEKKKFLSITAQPDETQPYGKDLVQVEQLLPTGSDGFLEVMMSAVESPSQFWLQLVGGRSRELDKLGEELTEYYLQPANRLLHELQEVAIGDIIAAPFQHDDLWYRARVVTVEEDTYNPKETKLHVYYVDFGDSETLILQDVCGLDKSHFQLPFQAIECTLAKVRPKGNVWTEEATLLFEQLTYAAQWKVIMARPLKRHDCSDCPSDLLPAVELVDTTGTSDVDVAEELVNKGFAIWIE